MAQKILHKAMQQLDREDAAAPMADERETAQWYAAGGIGVEAIKKLIAGVLGANTKEEKACYHFGGLKMWNGLPEQVRDALRRELYRIQTQATAPHQFEEIPGNRPILHDKCNQCGADRLAPIHNPAQPEYCHEHGEVIPVVDADSDVNRCPFCEHATSTTREEAKRFAEQDNETSLKTLDALVGVYTSLLWHVGEHGAVGMDQKRLDDARAVIAQLRPNVFS